MPHVRRGGPGVAGKIYAGLWRADVSLAGELSGDPDKRAGRDRGVFDHAGETDHNRVLKAETQGPSTPFAIPFGRVKLLSG